MLKLSLALGAVCLVGCASVGEWRTLTIDTSSDAAFEASVLLLNDELPYVHRQMFRFALADIVRTGLRNAEVADDGSPVYKDEDFRAEIDGLTYEGVVALADQDGEPVSRQLYHRRRVVMPPPPYGNLPGPEPTFRDNGYPAYNQYTLGWPVPGGGTVAVLPENWNGY